MPFFSKDLNISIESFSSLDLTDDEHELEKMDFAETVEERDEAMEVDARSPDHLPDPVRRTLLERGQEGPSGSSSTMGCRSLEPSPRSPDLLSDPVRRTLLERGQEGPSGSSSTMGCRSLEPTPNPTRHCQTPEISQEEECAQGTPPTPPSLTALPANKTPRRLWNFKNRFSKDSRTIGTHTSVDRRYTSQSLTKDLPSGTVLHVIQLT